MPIGRLIRVFVISAAAHATLNTEQLISHTKTAPVGTTASPQDSDRVVIPVLEVHELLAKIHDILNNALFKWVGNTAFLLGYFFNSTTRQHLGFTVALLP